MKSTSFQQACEESIVTLSSPGSIRLDRLGLPSPRAFTCGGREFLSLPEAGLEGLSRAAFEAIQFKLRADFLRDLARMASRSNGRERLVLETLVENSRAASAGTYPLCQDTGTAGVYAWKGDRIITEGNCQDAEILERGALAAWKAKRLRNSQLAPTGPFEEKNTADNGPLCCEIFSEKGADYRFLFLAKGGGSSNKTMLYQETKNVLEERAFGNFLAQAIGKLGVSACPPYTIGLAVGGQTPEQAILAAKLASAGALDAMPTAPGEGSPYRDLATEELTMRLAEESGWGAQFGGRFMARQARVVRLHRHAASLPIAIAVSCAAHRQAYGLANRDGFFLEHLCDANEIEQIITTEKQALNVPELRSPAYEAKAYREIKLGESNPAGLHAGEIVALSGKVVLVRDAAHARLRSMISKGESLPSWTRLPAYYASPTETPDGAILGSLGPTTAKRMDGYQDELMSRGAFLFTIGKGERGKACSDSCRKYGGTYFAAIGGAAATAAERHVVSAKTIDWPELGMEAVREIELKGLPVLVAVDSEGNDFYSPEFRR